MKSHMFDIDDAIKHGVEKAVILANFKFWIEKNAANGKNFHDGQYWTFNSREAYAKLFPYLSADKIGRHLRDLESQGVIRSGNYNKLSFDRTKWYCIPDYCVVKEEDSHCADSHNASCDSAQTIPDVNTDTKQDNKNPCLSVKDQFDEERIIPVWNSLGCKQHRMLTEKAAKSLNKTYKAYLADCKKKKKQPSPLNDWLEAYLTMGFTKIMTNHHKENHDGNWAADLEFAVRFDTYEKVKNHVQ